MFSSLENALYIWLLIQIYVLEGNKKARIETEREKPEKQAHEDATSDKQKYSQANSSSRE